MYSLKFSRLAARDLDEAFDYISDTLKNPPAAENLVLETEKRLRGILDFPCSCGFVADPYLRHLEIRFLPVNNYLLFLRVQEEKKEVEVVRFLYGKRAWEGILTEEQE